MGTVIGVIYTLNNRDKNQKILKSGAITGVLGGIISAFFISFYQLILIAILIVPDITVFFLYLGLSLVSAIAIGLIVGALISTYYTYREMKGETKVKESSIDDDFNFDELIKK